MINAFLQNFICRHTILCTLTKTHMRKYGNDATSTGRLYLLITNVMWVFLYYYNLW